jgi:hypothetical protein
VSLVKGMCEHNFPELGSIIEVFAMLCRIFAGLGKGRQLDCPDAFLK